MKITVFLAIALISSISRAEEGEIQWRKTCGGTYNLCGFADESGSVKIPQNYLDVLPFSENLAAVKTKTGWGYINRQGAIVIPPNYDLASPIHCGLASVQTGKRIGIINAEGKMLVPPQFSDARVVGRNWIVAGTDGRSADRLDLPEFISSNNHQTPWGIFEVSKGWVTKKEFQFAEFSQNCGGYIWAKYANAEGEDKYGLLASDGKWKLEPKFSHVQPLMDDAAIVVVGNGKERKPGAIDSHGKILIEPQSKYWLSYFRNGYAPLSENGGDRKGKKGVMDKKGRVLGGRLFDEVEVSEEGGQVIVKEHGKWREIDQAGNLKSSSSPDNDLLESSRPAKSPKKKKGGFLLCEGSTVFHESGKWGIKADDGHTIIAAKYRAIHCFRGGLTWVPVDAKKMWCALGIDGEISVKEECRPSYYFVDLSEATPETLNKDPFESSVAWNRKLLEYAAGIGNSAPNFISSWDGKKFPASDFIR